MPRKAAATKVNGLVLVGQNWIPEGGQTAPAGQAIPDSPKKRKGKKASPKAKELIATLQAMAAAPTLQGIVQAGQQIAIGIQEGWIGNLNRRRILGSYAIALRTFASLAEQ